MSQQGNYHGTLTWRNFFKANDIRKKLEKQVKEEKTILNISKVSNVSETEIKDKLDKLNLSSQDMLDFYCSFGRFPDINEAKSVNEIGIEHFSIMCR